MSDAVIRVENLSKKYIIGHQSQERYQTFRDKMANSARDLGKRLLHPFRSSTGIPSIDASTSEEFWALRDVSFEIKQGDRVGIIGSNGAGKSTLLKILSRITEPTSGRIEITGRVASLLEVGTGFHPELTGRENIYLNGAILGMSRSEIKRKFDEIVAFSEVAKFLDTPVKRYSSGMYVRLAFAVAAHMEPEILIVDEVLAVGDIRFQQKCLGKMEEVGKEGRTVIFVSHNMSVIKNLCNNGILLSEGVCVHKGSSGDVIDHYLRMNNDVENNKSLRERTRKKKPDKIMLIGTKIHNITKDIFNEAETLDSIDLIIDYEILSPIKCFAAEWAIKDSNGNALAFSSSSPMGNVLYYPNGEYGQITCKIPKIPLAIGEYKFSVGVTIPNIELLDGVEDACTLSIIASDPYKNGYQHKGDRAPVFIECEWLS